MSILIRGMEMPKSCKGCRFAVDGFCCAYPGVNIFALQENIRPEWCPLVEVPPHGRLIDADRLSKKLIIGPQTLCYQAEIGIALNRESYIPTIIDADPKDYKPMLVEAEPKEEHHV